jgi:hypothetical protein
VITPLDAIAGSLARAKLVIEHPRGQPDIPLRFNPTEYRIQKSNNFAEIGIPGLESPPLQFVRGGAAELSVEVLLDTSDTLDDVRQRYTDRILGLLKVSPELHAPPIVLFVWDRNVFRGVLTSAQATFSLFTPTGVPIRATIALSIKEYRPVEVRLRNESPDFEKIYVVRRGDTLSSIAAWAYQDPTKWRLVAEANGIRDPRRVAPGAVLTLPRLR